MTGFPCVVPLPQFRSRSRCVEERVMKCLEDKRFVMILVENQVVVVVGGMVVGEMEEQEKAEEVEERDQEDRLAVHMGVPEEPAHGRRR